jgi:hypothetical protein
MTTNQLISIIFQGETAGPSGPRGRKRGRSRPRGGLLEGQTLVGFPVPTAAEYPQIVLLGMWTRLADQIMDAVQDYASDPPDHPPAVNGVKPGWKITDIISDLLVKANGGNTAELDIPSNDMRLMGSPRISKNAYILLPGAYIKDQLAYMTRSFNGWVLLRDPNAAPTPAAGADLTKPQGMWRLLNPPSPPYTNVLAEFHSATDLGVTNMLNPSGLGRVPEAPNAFAGVARYPTAAQTYIRDGTLTKHVDPPEATEVRVVGASGPIGADSGAIRLERVLRNFNAADAPGAPTGVPSDPSYLGRTVRILIIDAALADRTSVDLMARRVYQQACFGRPFVTFEAPLVLVGDPLDQLQVRARPLRIYDTVFISDPDGFLALPPGGQTGLVRSCNPHYDRTDKIQMATYEVYLVDQTAVAQGSPLP